MSETIEVWNFAEAATEPLVVTQRLTVRVRGAVVGEIDLSRIFPGGN